MSVEADRWDEIRKIHVDWADAYRIFGGVVLVLLGIWIGSILFSGDSGYSTNLYTELISIAITVFILDFLNGKREESRRIEETKVRLLRDIRSPENSVANQAAHELQEYGWIRGETGLLQKANLEGAKLQGANLEGAKLQGATLFQAKLQGANLELANLHEANLELANLHEATLWGANLQGANLGVANLQGANLGFANLQGANVYNANLREVNLVRANLKGAYLERANLKGANLVEAHLEGANLTEANLQGVDLKKAIFNEQTILPDGSYWRSDVDMARFTDPDHPQFWRSEDEDSPAYRHKKEDE